MKQIYLTISAIALSMIGLAQGSRTANQPNVELNPANMSLTKVINNPNPAPQAAGDTVWIFDGAFSYNWDGNLPVSYSVALEDLDGFTHTSGYVTYFGSTGHYKFFYYQDINATQVHYGHADTVFFAASTSWFATPGTSNDWIEFGPIAIPANGGTLSWVHNYVDFGYRDGYEVRVNTTGLASTNFTGAALFTVADNDPSTVGDTVNTPQPVWYPRSTSLAAYAGQQIYLAFRHNANDQNILEFTNVMITENAGTGINNQNNGFFIGTNMPNPAVNSTSINYTLDKSSNVSFTVTDITGKVMMSENLSDVAAGANKVEVNTASFSNGMYFYTFLINGHSVTQKFVVAH